MALEVRQTRIQDRDRYQERQDTHRPHAGVGRVLPARFLGKQHQYSHAEEIQIGHPPKLGHERQR